MPNEKQMWERLQPHMFRLGMDPVRVENPALPGTPDVNFIQGWAELKHTDRWPPRGGPLNLDHPPTPQQLIWLLRRWDKGGACWLVLRVGQEWFLFSGLTTFDLWRGGRKPLRSELEAHCALHVDNPAAVAERLKLGR